MSAWYLAKNQKKIGPFSAAKLKELADAGQLSPNDYLLREGTAQWVEASEFPGLFAAKAAAIPAPPKHVRQSREANIGMKFWLGVAAGGGGALILIALAFLIFGGKSEPKDAPSDPLAKVLDKGDAASKDKPSPGGPKPDPKEKTGADPDPLKKAMLAKDALRVTGAVKFEPIERTENIGDRMLRYTLNQIRLNLAIQNDADHAIKLGNTLMVVETDNAEQMEGVLAGFRLAQEPDLAKQEERWHHKLAYGLTTIESRYVGGRQFTLVGPVRNFDLFSVINNTRWQEDSRADRVPTNLAAKESTTLTATFNRLHWLKDEARHTVRIALPELVVSSADGSDRYRLIASLKKSPADAHTWEVSETQLVRLDAASLGRLVNEAATSLDKAVLAANWWVEADAKAAFSALSGHADGLSSGRLLHSILQLSTRHKDVRCRARAGALLGAPAAKLDIAIAAATYLAALGDDPDVSALVTAAGGRNVDEATAVIFTLGQLKTAGAVAALRKLLKDPALAARHRQIQANLDLIEKSAKDTPKGTPKTETKTEARILLPPMSVGRADAILFSPNSKTLLLGNTKSGALDGRVSVWNIAEGKKEKDLIAGRLHFATSLALSPDGKVLAMGGIIQTTLNDAATGRNISALGESATVVTFSSDSKLFLSNGGDLDGKIKVWEVYDPKIDPMRPTPATKLRTTLKKHAGAVLCLAWAGDGKSFASGSADATIKVWIPAELDVKATLEGHKGGVLAIAYSPDSTVLVSGGADKTVRFWDLATQKAIGNGTAHDAAVTRIAIHPKGKIAASAGGDQRIVLWDMDTQTKLGVLPITHQHARSLAFSPDGQWLAVLCDQTENLCVTPQIELFRSDALRDSKR